MWTEIFIIICILVGIPGLLVLGRVIGRRISDEVDRQPPHFLDGDGT